MAVHQTEPRHLRLFQFDNVHHVFESQWFEVKFIWNWEVCWNRLRVRVHDDSFATCSLDSFYRVNCSISRTQLPLSNTDRTWTKSDEQILYWFDWFIFPPRKLQSRNTVLRLELSRTEHHLGRQEQCFPNVSHELGRLFDSKDQQSYDQRNFVTLSFFKTSTSPTWVANFLFQFKDVEQFIKEEDINLSRNSDNSSIVYPRRMASERWKRRSSESFDNFLKVVCNVRKFRHFIVVNTDFANGKWRSDSMQWDW